MTVRRLLVTCLCLWLWLMGMPELRALADPVSIAQASPSDSIDTLRQQQQQLEQQRSNLEQEQKRLQNLEGAAQDRLGNLQQTIQSTTEQIQQNEQKLQQATQELQQLQAKLAVAEQGFQDKQFATVARLRYLQRQKNYQGWATLLQSKSLEEFLDRRQQLKRVYQSDQQILTDLRKEADVLEANRRDVEGQKNEIALLTQQLQLQKSQFEAQAQTQQELIGRLQKDRGASEEAEEQLARDSASLATLIQARLAEQSRQQIVTRGTGRFSFPSNGAITSNFGWRIHPILGYQRFHSGVDFGADYGSSIRSADSGTVIFAGWYGGYGLAVIVDHGDGLTTLYAHTSEVYVEEGQSITRGEAIAAVGSTGLSTGPHLHFEVRSNGDPVDPAPYL